MIANIFLKSVKVWRSLRNPFVLLVSVIVLFLFGVYLFSQTRIVGDAASHLLLVISPILEIGSPYKDYWDIKPPVLPLILYFWSNLFGFSILSIRIINITIATLLVLLIYLVYKKIFLSPTLEIIFLYTIIVTFSPLLNSIMLPTEILGTLISLSALIVLINFRKDFSKFYFSGLLFFAASQTKEPFAFTALAILPVFINSMLQGGFSRLIKNFAQFLLGVFTSLTGIYVYLASFGSVGAYAEVFKFKQTFFPLTFDRLSLNFLPGFFAAERTFIEFSRGFSILIVLAVLSFYLADKFKKTLSFNSHNSRLTTKPLVVMDPDKLKKYTAFFFAFGSFLGVGLGGSFGSHYLIQVVIPFYIMGGLIISYLFHNTSFLLGKSKPSFYTALLLLGFSLIILMPKRPYLSSYLPTKTNFTIKDHTLGFEKRITEITTKDQCILSVYGWGVSENYLYSMRKPCTRFFLPNMVFQDWQKKEYARDVVENPPAVIIYQTASADTDIQKFESEVININKIVKNCYVQDMVENVIYIPKTNNTTNLKICIKTNSI